ncbi:MAG TPA: ABC transporter ATP-binding protein [Candidatus Limnocylindria bacterium]|jgi:putative ABC transport system ATP-binding protein|nr:ABC transporter ATP-binding protein [Candidatus Limnocylindria bacterium]
MPEPILSARQLTKVYRRGASEVRAVDGIDLDVAPGEFMAIMGRSGSGKTTLLDLLGCLLRPTSGELTIDGRSVVGASDGALAALRRQRIGFVFQEFNLIPTLTAVENVLLPLRYGPRRRDGRQRATELLDLVGLADRATHRPTELSGGEQQRVAIARALVNEPAVILADEPTGELDSVTSDRLMSTLRELNHERGVTTIIVTHDAGVAGATDRVVRLQDGHVLADARRQGGNGHAFDAALTGQPHTNGGGRVWARLGDLLDRARGR